MSSPHRFPTRCGFLTLIVATLFLSLPSCGLLGPAVGLGMMKLQFGCLPEGSRVDTPTGPVAIEHLTTGDTVIGFHGKPVRIRQIHQYLEDERSHPYLTLGFSNGSSFSASPKHRVNGIPAADLKTGDHVGPHTVTQITELRGVTRSFDLLTEDPGYQLGSIPVNSMIEEMLSSGH